MAIVNLGKAQVALYPNNYSILPIAIHFNNPAFCSNTHKTEFLIIDQRFLSPFNSFTNKHIGFKYQIKKNDSTNVLQNILFKASNEQQGTYISKNRAGIGYGVTKYISSEIWLSAGTSIGFVNFNYNGTDALTTGSDFALDGDVGVAVGSKKNFLGLRSNQIFNSKLKPINAIFVVKRYLELYAQHKFELNHNYNLNLYAQSQVYKGKEIRFEFGAMFFIQTHIAIGTSYTLKSKNCFQVCLNQLKTKLGTYNLIISYATPISNNSNLKIQSLDIGLVGNFKILK